MEREKNAREETAAELCKRADAEKDYEGLLQLAIKLRPLIEARWPRTKPTAQVMNRVGAESSSPTPEEQALS